jgi:hypothetical protein
MKAFHYILPIGLIISGSTACNKLIDLKPESNITVDQYYRNYDEVKAALTGVYNGMQKPLLNEWSMTELRSDMSKQGSPNSTATANIDLNDLNTYLQATFHDGVYDYWYATYKNIRSANYVLRSIGVAYANGETTMGEGTALMNEDQKKQLAGEALFIRAFHYYNLVRLYGGIFIIVDQPTTTQVKKIPRSSEADCLKFIESDLKAAAAFLPAVNFSAQKPDDLGRATKWAAETLLAKLYLQLNRKTEALTLLDDVITNSGHGMLPSYADVFSVTNEVNKEILFTVRFKAGGFGLGNHMANSFAALNSGSTIVNGNGSGLNYPTANLEAKYIAPATGFADKRKAATIARYNALSYVKKFISPVMVKGDAENDFPVIRYSDVLLLKAEALGFTPESVDLINEVRARAGAGIYPGNGSFTAQFYLYPASGVEAITEDNFLDKLLEERRIEFAFENQRLFDLHRTGKFYELMEDYYESEYDSHYKRFKPAIALDALKQNLHKRPLLPIPQRELDTNNEIEIGQNDGY